MEKKELIEKTLTDMGYSPRFDEDGDILLKCQKKNLVIQNVSREGDNFIQIIMPWISDVDEGEEMIMLTVCNKLNRDIRIVKYWIAPDMKSVSLTYEMVFTEDSLQMQIDNGIKSLMLARSQFSSTYNKYKSELEEDETEE